MTPHRLIRIVCVLAAGLALASLPFLQYRWPVAHQHGHVASAEHGGH